MTQWASWKQAIVSLAMLVSFSLFGQQNVQTPPEVVQARFIGNETCIDCHQVEVEAWQGSHHDMAMRHADSESVLGNFDNQAVEHQGKANRFYRKGDEYWVNIQGPDGQWHDYKISYTFGWVPLQQYMVEFDDGRIQLIPFAWDSRSVEQGGQRWFHLYPDTTTTDEFYWTNTGKTGTLCVLIATRPT